MSQFKNDSKCAFIYFLIFMGTLIGCFGMVGVWHALNAIYNGEIDQNLWQYGRLRSNMATLLIAFPFLSLMLYIAQINLRKGNFSVSTPFRRWIIYGGLSLGAIFIFHALSQIIEHFLGGALVRTSLIDSGILIIVVGLASSFFLIDVTRKEVNLTRIQKGIFLVALFGFITTTYVGFSYNKSHKEVENLTKNKSAPSEMKTKMKGK